MMFLKIAAQISTLSTITDASSTGEFSIQWASVIPALRLVFTLRDIPSNPRVTALALILLCLMDTMLEVVPPLTVTL
jgi:hypothetical protein